MNLPRMIQMPFFPLVPFSNDDTERPSGVRSLDTFLLQDMDVNDKVQRCAKEI